MKVEAVRGTKDIFGLDALKMDFIIDTGRKVFERYEYEKMLTPIFEKTELFQRGIGEGTDIVEKEMYTFLDKGERSITLRPEGTASVVRAYIQNKLYKDGGVNKFYYYGPMFRYERPQKGRYREFYQLGAELLGTNLPVFDAEIISMAYKFLQAIGVEDIQVELNSVGEKESRDNYRDGLMKFLETKLDNLCDDCKVRYEKNPLRILDCKVKTCKDELVDSPKLLEFLVEEDKQHFEEVKKYLEIFGVPYIINHKLVRGLDYYTNTVFEITTNKLGAQGTVLAGGRYNKLINEIGGKDVPAIGFAAGVERLSLLLNDFERKIGPEITIVWIGQSVKDYAISLLDSLREKSLTATMDYEEKSMKSQMKKADKNNSKYAIIIGEEEIETGKVLLRNLEDGEQESLSREEIINKFKKI